MADARALLASNRPSARLLTRDDVPGFVARFTLIFGALLVLPWLVSLADLHGAMGYLVTAVATAVVLVAYRWRPVEALLAFVLFIAFYDSIALHVGDRIRQTDDLAIPFLGLMALAGVWRSWRAWMWWPREAGVAVVVAMGLASSFAAGVPPEVWFPGLFLLLKSIGFLYLATWTPFRRAELQAMMWIGLAVGIVVLALGFVELRDPAAFQKFFGLNSYVRLRGESFVVKSLFVHPNLFGFFTAFLALFGYAAFVVTRRWRWLFLGAFLGVGAFLSARRRAIVAMGVGLAAAFVRSVSRRRDVGSLVREWVPITASVIVLVVVFLPGLVGLYELTVSRYVNSTLPPITQGGGGGGGGSQGSSGSGTTSDTQDAQARIALYVGSVEIARDYFPVGGGLGRYGSWMSRVEYSPLYVEYGLSRIRGLRRQNPTYATDTFWPQILGETGILGLLGYAAFLAAIGFLLWRESQREGDTTTKIFRLAAGMVFAQALTESLASAMFHSPPRVYLLYLVVGAVISMAWYRSESDTDQASERTLAAPT